MGVYHYDCYVCRANGVYEEYVVHCEECGAHICSDCAGCSKDDTDYVDWENEKLNTVDEGSSLKKEYCKSCKDIENNKYVYVVLFKEKDIMDFTTISTVELFHNEIKAKERQAELINEYYLKKNNGKEYTGKRELFKTIGMKYGADCWIEKREII